MGGAERVLDILTSSKLGTCSCCGARPGAVTVMCAALTPDEKRRHKKTMTPDAAVLGMTGSEPRQSGSASWLPFSPLALAPCPLSFFPFSHSPAGGQEGREAEEAVSAQCSRGHAWCRGSSTQDQLRQTACSQRPPAPSGPPCRVPLIRPPVSPDLTAALLSTG